MMKLGNKGKMIINLLHDTALVQRMFVWKHADTSTWLLPYDEKNNAPLEWRRNQEQDIEDLVHTVTKRLKLMVQGAWACPERRKWVLLSLLRPKFILSRLFFCLWY